MSFVISSLTRGLFISVLLNAKSSGISQISSLRMSDLILWSESTLCVISVLLNFSRFGLWPRTSWQTLCVHLKRTCISLLLGDVSCKCPLRRAGYDVVRGFYTFTVSHFERDFRTRASFTFLHTFAVLRALCSGGRRRPAPFLPASRQRRDPAGGAGCGRQARAGPGVRGADSAGPRWAPRVVPSAPSPTCHRHSDQHSLEDWGAPCRPLGCRLHTGLPSEVLPPTALASLAPQTLSSVSSAQEAAGIRVRPVAVAGSSARQRAGSPSVRQTRGHG